MLRISHISPLSLRQLILAGALLLLCLSSCSRVQSIREARTIVAEADSLRSAGQSLSPFTFHLSPSQSDSTSIASAVYALEPLRLIYPSAYAHANYYYGRILREAGNHPEAMLAFLRVVHSRTKDHAIKGRAYSNMGTMCHLTDDHGLAYDMYSLSANQFLMNDDSLLYFYSLNNMAYELAEQGDKSGVYDLLAKVESQCLNEDVLTKVIETKAEACIKVNENDSALYYSIMLWERGNHEPTGLLIRAQAYDNLGEKDSALLYANLLLESSDFYGDRFNALYILTHNDTTINVEEVLSLTSDRTDIQMDYTEVRATLSQATQLLEQDLNRKPDLRWFYAILVTLLLIGIGITAYVNRKRRQHRLLSQQMKDIQQRKLEEIEKYCGYLQNCTNLEQELCWTNYDRMCEIINRNMYQLILSLQSYDNLTEGDIRLCVLVLIDLSYANMASMLKLSKKSISKLKSIAAHKLNTNMKNLREKLLEIACNSVAK